MTMFLIQSAILLAIAFVLGAIVGCLLKRMFTSEDATVPMTTAAIATAATAAAVSNDEPKSETLRALQSHPEPDPAVAAPVMSVAPVVSMPKAAVKPKVAARPKVAVTPKAAIAPNLSPKAKVVAAVPATVKDDLKLIVGIGPVNERKLNSHGVSTFAQIAGWKKPDIVEAEKYLEFDGRIEREEWVRQAKLLAKGGKSEDKAELARKGRRAAEAQTPAVKSKPVAKPIVSATVKKEKPAAKPVLPAVSKANPANPSAKAKEKPVAASIIGKPPAKHVAAKSEAKSASVKLAAPKSSPVKKPMAIKLAKPVGGKPDNLTLINGIGNVIEKKLHELGVFHFEQLANWNDDQAAHFSKAVGFPGRAKREGWMKEAALFAKGGTTEHARKVEAGDIPTSRKSTKTEKAKP